MLSPLRSDAPRWLNRIAAIIASAVGALFLGFALTHPFVEHRAAVEAISPAIPFAIGAFYWALGASYFAPPDGRLAAWWRRVEAAVGASEGRILATRRELVRARLEEVSGVRRRADLCDVATTPPVLRRRAG